MKKERIGSIYVFRKVCGGLLTERAQILILMALLIIITVFMLGEIIIG